MKSYTYFVTGMHCNACVLLTETELQEHPLVTNVKSQLSSTSVEVTGEFGEKSKEEIMRELIPLLSQHSLSIEQTQKKIAWHEFQYAIPFAMLFVGLFIALQKLGIVNLITSSEVGYSSAFIIGIIASLSSCMAVVGGLVLSLSANYAKQKSSIRPHVIFHVSRVLSFFVLGGVIGTIGATFQLGSVGTLLIGLVVAFVLLILGINLLDIIPSTKKLQISLPNVIGKSVSRLKNLQGNVMPLLLGAATFFMPCGFTQSMQIYTLSAGSFWNGGMIMLSFALGTLPVLALLSFGSSKITSSQRSGVFYKTAGIVVLFFGVFNLVNSLVAAGLMRPFFTL